MILQVQFENGKIICKPTNIESRYLYNSDTKVDKRNLGEKD